MPTKKNYILKCNAKQIVHARERVKIISTGEGLEYKCGNCFAVELVILFMTESS